MEPLHSVPLCGVFGNLRWGQWQASTPSLAVAVSVSLNLINLSQYWLSSIHTFTHSFTDTHTHTPSSQRRHSKTWRHTKITPNYFRVRNVTSSLPLSYVLFVRVTSMWTRKRQLGRIDSNELLGEPVHLLTLVTVASSLCIVSHTLDLLILNM